MANSTWIRLTFASNQATTNRINKRNAWIRIEMEIYRMKFSLNLQYCWLLSVWNCCQLQYSSLVWVHREHMPLVTEINSNKFHDNTWCHLNFNKLHCNYLHIWIIFKVWTFRHTLFFEFCHISTWNKRKAYEIFSNRKLAMMVPPNVCVYWNGLHVFTRDND